MDSNSPEGDDFFKIVLKEVSPNRSTCDE